MMAWIPTEDLFSARRMACRRPRWQLAALAAQSGKLSRPARLGSGQQQGRQHKELTKDVTCVFWLAV